MPSDIEIAQAAKMNRITQVVQEKLGISDEHLEPYGHYKAKISLEVLVGNPKLLLHHLRDAVHLSCLGDFNI